MAGRPKGCAKTGGRKRGTPNRVQSAAREAAAQSGELPLDYMLRIMRDAGVDSARRDAMATAAAPYLHARLAAMTIGGDKDNPLHVVDDSAARLTGLISGLAARLRESGAPGGADK